MLESMVAFDCRDCIAAIGAAVHGNRAPFHGVFRREGVARCRCPAIPAVCLKKNLRVKLRKGRQYDFTDPEGNADRLCVFHRDVAKAADRLRKGDSK